MNALQWNGCKLEFIEGFVETISILPSKDNTYFSQKQARYYSLMKLQNDPTHYYFEEHIGRVNYGEMIRLWSEDESFPICRGFQIIKDNIVTFQVITNYSSLYDWKDQT